MTHWRLSATCALATLVVAGFCVPAPAQALREMNAQQMLSRIASVTKQNPLLTLRDVQFEGNLPLPASKLEPLYAHMLGLPQNLKDLMELTRILKRGLQLAGCPLQLSVMLHKLQPEEGVVVLRVTNNYNRSCPQADRLAGFDARAVRPLEEPELAGPLPVNVSPEVPEPAKQPVAAQEAPHDLEHPIILPGVPKHEDHPDTPPVQEVIQGGDLTLAPIKPAEDGSVTELPTEAPVATEVPAIPTEPQMAPIAEEPTPEQPVTESIPAVAETPAAPVPMQAPTPQPAPVTVEKPAPEPATPTVATEAPMEKTPEPQPAPVVAMPPMEKAPQAAKTDMTPLDSARADPALKEAAPRIFFRHEITVQKGL